MNGQTLRKQYKEVISGFREWAEADHANKYLIFPDNIGENLSLDETSLSNGDVYTLLTNKAGKGKKGTLVAIIQGVSADNINKILRKIPYKHREKVKTITTDLSSAMMLIAKTTFPSATLINDRFHVQQLMNEAVDQLRIAYRWEVLERENEEIRQYREKEKQLLVRKNVTLLANGYLSAIQMEKHFHKFWLRADMFSESTRVSGTNNSNKEHKSCLNNFLVWNKLMDYA